MPHPLDSCDLRIRRTNRYIEETKSLMRGFADKCEDSIIASAHTNSVVEFPEIPTDLPLAISDCVHNLRSALDYMVYQLAIKDSGAVQEGTQFPIESHKSGISTNGHKFGFDAVAPRFLRGLSQPHRDCIELLQPYSGGKWMQTLKDISNPDKHRHLIPIKREDAIAVWTVRPDQSSKKLPDGTAIKADPTHTIFIELVEGQTTLIDPTLYSLQAAVADIVNSFKSEF